MGQSHISHRLSMKRRLALVVATSAVGFTGAACAANAPVNGLGPRGAVLGTDLLPVQPNGSASLLSAQASDLKKGKDSAEYLRRYLPQVWSPPFDLAAEAAARQPAPGQEAPRVQLPALFQQPEPPPQANAFSGWTAVPRPIPPWTPRPTGGLNFNALRPPQSQWFGPTMVGGANQSQNSN
jgi:hypothetical protein